MEYLRSPVGYLSSLDPLPTPDSGFVMAGLGTKDLALGLLLCGDVLWALASGRYEEGQGEQRVWAALERPVLQTMRPDHGYNWDHNPTKVSGPENPSRVIQSLRYNLHDIGI